MPCVLPVLAIKIFAITDLARAERGHVVRHGLAYLAGVVASHTVLPVIGIPVPTQLMGGLDSLLSTAQMPGDVPVATVSPRSARP